jgi:hypothetical protein
MKKTAWAVLAVLVLAPAAALAADQPRVGPPPPRTEAPTLQPGPVYVWVPGYWKWAGINYEWIDGRWVVGKRGKTWVPGSWEQVGARWAWKPGKWVDPAAEARAKAKAEAKAAAKTAKESAKAEKRERKK